MKELLKFLKSQRLITIASYNNDLWISNAYACTDDNFNIYFISPTKAKHSKYIEANSNIVFSFSWFDPKNLSNRKGVQGKGECKMVKNPIELAKGIKHMYDSFPEMRDILTLKWITENVWGTKLWVIKPTYIKHWDDEVYGEEENKEFNF